MSETKLKDDPFFLITALCLFYPIGIFFLIRSNLKKKTKWLIACTCILVFSSLLSLSLIVPNHPIVPADFQLIVTRNELSVGQSGGLIISNGEQYYTDYTVTASNDNLKINGNAYTAVKPGKCTITANFAEECRKIEITIQDKKGMDSPVLVTLTGERYHLASAKHVGKNATEMTEEEALQSGKTPCKTCYKQ